MLVNKLKISRSDNPEQQRKIKIGSLEQYENMKLHVSVEEVLEDRTFQNLDNFCIVFDDMSDCSHKMFDPNFSREKQYFRLFVIFYNHTSIHLNESLEPTVAIFFH